MHKITSCSAEHRPMPLLNTEWYSDELWGYVSSQLGQPNDLMALRATNQHLYNICLSTPQWEALLEKYFPSSLAKARSPADYPDVYREGALTWGLFKNTSAPCNIFNGFQKFCVHENLLFSDLLNGSIEISDIKARKVVQTLKLKRGVFAFFQVQGDFFCTAGNNRTEVWRISTGQRIHAWDFTMSVDFFQLQGDLLCIGSQSGQVKVWNVCTGELMLELTNATAIKDFQLDGGFLFLGGTFQIGEEESEDAVKMWDIHKGCIVNTFQAPPGSSLMTGMHYLKRQGEFLAVMAPSLEEVGIWNTTTGKFLRTIKNDGWLLREAFCAVQGNFFLAIGSKTKIWDMRTGELLHELDELGGYNPRFEVYGDFLIVLTPLHAQTENTVVTGVWNIPLGKRIGTFTRQDTIWLGPLSQRDGDFLCVESDKGIMTWDLLPHPSGYERTVLENNLITLQYMAQTPPLLGKLDPRIQWHLERTDPPCLKRVQTIVRLELLLHAVYDQDEERTCTLLNELALSVPFEKGTPRREKIQVIQTLLADLYATAEVL
jgi:WD40 repeat protein